MRRETLGTAGHAARMGSMSRGTARKFHHDTIFPNADMDAGRNDSPKGVPVVQPYGFAYWPKSQSEDQQQGGQSGEQGAGGADGSGGGPGDAAGAGAFESDSQPKGKSAIGLTSYGNGSRSDPSVQNFQDPRHQLMLENTKQQNQQVASAGGGQSGGGGGQQQGGEDHGGREGDVAMYQMKDKNIQLHFAGGDGKDLKPGAYLSTDKSKNRIKLQLVEVEEQQQGGSQGGQGGGGQSGQGQGGGESHGQRPLLKKQSDIFIDVDGDKVTIKKGDSVVILDGKKVVAYQGDETKSMRVDANHTHIRHAGNRIWVDANGCHSSSAITLASCTDD